MFPPRSRPPMPPRRQGSPHPPFQRSRPPFRAQPMRQQPPQNPLNILQSIFQGNQQQGNPRFPGSMQPGQLQQFMQHFQTPDGEWDIEKIISTAQQVNGVYKQVSPLVSNVTKLIKKD